MEDIFIETAHANADAFLDVKAKGETFDFLKREDYIGLRACRTTDLAHEAVINLIPDIDGIVLEHKTLSGLLVHIRYFHILPSGTMSGLISIYSIIKKHLPLKNYSHQNLALLRDARAAQLFSVDGWQFFITILPNERTEFNTGGKSCGTFVLDWLLDLKRGMVNVLTQLESKDLNRVSVKKNRILDVSKWTVAPGDQGWYLQLLDFCIESSDIPYGFQAFRFSVRFGERQTNAIRLGEYVQLATLNQMSVHAAVTIDLSPVHVNGFWSKIGISRVIGNRGSVMKSLTLSETNNFQSNLDGKDLDIKPALKRVACVPESLNFIQMYVDTPHMYPCRKYNPVSGSITTCGILHPKSKQYIENSADDYLSIMKENSVKIAYPIRPRIEIVCLTSESKELIMATDYIDISNVIALLNDFPMLIPVSEYHKLYPPTFTFSQAIKTICNDIVDELKSIYINNKGFGGYLESWKSFQMELALEHMFFGRTLCGLSRQTATILLSHRLGFLNLEEPNSTTIDETVTPPLSIWTQNEDQKERIQRIFNVTNYLNSSLPVMGKIVIISLVNDLITDKRFNVKVRDEAVLITCLKSDNRPSWAQCAGVISYDALAENIIKGVYRYPLIFGRVMGIMEYKRIDITTLIISGIKELKFYHFPALRYVDKNKNRNTHWTGNALWRISLTNNLEYDARKLTETISTDMAAKDLIYQSKLLYIFNDENIIFPWIDSVMKRLEGLGLDNKGKQDVLLYMSCIAFLMQGLYIDYNRMNDLVLPIKLCRLQELNILSQSILVGLNNMKIYKLHADIGFKFETSVSPCNKKQRVTQATLGPGEQRVDIPFIDPNETREQVIEPEPIIHRSANYMGLWKSEEIEILDQLLFDYKDRNWRSMYTYYLDKCRELHIPDRSYSAFQKKIKGLKKTENF